jgi:hypothetical protein
MKTVSYKLQLAEYPLVTEEYASIYIFTQFADCIGTDCK